MIRVVGKIRVSLGFENARILQVSEKIFSLYGDKMLHFIKKYPPQRNEDSRYIRGFGYGNRRVSEDLGARWNKRVRIVGNSVVMDVGNNASYAQYVQAQGLQAEIHEDWWQTDQQMIDEFLPDMLTTTQNQLQRIIGG